MWHLSPQPLATDTYYGLHLVWTVHSCLLLCLCEIIHQLCPRLSNVEYLPDSNPILPDERKSKKKNTLLTLDLSPRGEVLISCVITIIFVQIVICDYCRPAVVSIWPYKPLLSQLSRCRLAACYCSLSSTVKCEIAEHNTCSWVFVSMAKDVIKTQVYSE